MKVAIQGERGSFHEVAALQYLGSDTIDLYPCATFDSTVNAVLTGEADIGVMAIENARSGSILYNYSLIRESGLKVIGEHKLRIKQNLMALPGQSIEDIRAIWSHPVAIAQCMAFLNLYPAVALIESDDTAASAKKIRNEGAMGVAAIGADIAARIYGLDIIASGIETYKNNYTRFLIIGSEIPDFKDFDKASVCFALGHQPDSLAKLLVMLAEREVNLSKIQSVPGMMSEWEYMFYLDLELNGSTDREELIELLKQNTIDPEILGLYKKRGALYESSAS